MDFNLALPRAERAGEGGEPTEAEEDESGEEDFERSEFLARALGLEDATIQPFGWLQGNFTGNPKLGNRGMNFGVTPNNLANTYVIQQFYFVVEKPLHGGDEFDWGFRLDNLFGSDWQNFHSLGLFDNAFVPDHFGYDPVQAYADVHLPLLTDGGIDLKAGRFYALPGYEDGIAPGRPLLSTSYLFSYAHPFTHVGVMSTWHVTDRINLSNGVVNGWDRWINSTYRWGYAGAASWDSENERTSVVLTLNVGPNQVPRFPSSRLNDIPNGIVHPASLAGRVNPYYGANNVTLLSAVLVRKWTDRITGIVEGDYARETGVPAFNPAGRLVPRTNSWSGVAAWGLYEWTPEWTGVCRAEVFFDPDGLRTGVADTFYELTLGLIAKPRSWFWIRPEIRYDWAARTHPFNNDRSTNQLTLGFDTILLF